MPPPVTMALAPPPEPLGALPTKSTAASAGASVASVRSRAAIVSRREGRPKEPAPSSPRVAPSSCCSAACERRSPNPAPGHPITASSHPHKASNT
eukprot:7364471-Prymnesium_polylepis.1